MGRGPSLGSGRELIQRRLGLHIGDPLFELQLGDASLWDASK